MRILPVDPGTVGAYTVFGDTVWVADLPVHHVRHRRSAKDPAALDLHGFRSWFDPRAITHVLIERARAVPKQGLGTTCRFGESSGALCGLVVGLITLTLCAHRRGHVHHVSACPTGAAACPGARLTTRAVSGTQAKPSLSRWAADRRT
jgi:hypothetical protein